MSFVFVLKQPKVHDLILDAYLHPPLLCARHPTHTKKTRRVTSYRSPLVFSVYAVAYDSKVGNSVIDGIPVDMVNLSIRPTTMHIKPSQTMREAVISKNSDSRVTLFCLGAGNTPDSNRVGGGEFPCKNAGHSVVIEGGSEGGVLKHEAIIVSSTPPDYSLHSMPAKLPTTK